MSDTPLVNLEKRIRRHVRGREHRLAGICHPALQDLGLQELKSLGMEAEIVSPGVIEFSGRIDDLMRVHLQSRIMVSFRVRLLDFRCGSREDLFSRIRNFPWEYWVKPETGFQVRINSRQSRISHEGRAAESVFKALRGRMNEAFPGPGPDAAEGPGAPAGSDALAGPGPGPASNGSQKIYINLEGSRALVSLDATGELLYRRGYLPAQGKAPLRENLAAAIFAAAPFALRGPLLDGMAGGGTLLAEGFLTATGMSPVPRRDFAFCKWPVFNPAALDAMRKKLAADNGNALSDWESGRPGAGLYASELDPDVHSLLQRNMNDFCRHFNLEGRPSEPRAFCSDFFELVYDFLDLAEPGQKPAGTLLLNPPYNWRIPLSNGLFRRLWHLLQEPMSRWNAVILVPLDERRHLLLEPQDLPSRDLLSRCSTRDFPHGGRWIRVFYVHGIPLTP